MGEAKFPRIFGTHVLVNFGTVIVECKYVLLSTCTPYTKMWFHGCCQVFSCGIAWNRGIIPIYSSSFAYTQLTYTAQAMPCLRLQTIFLEYYWMK